jgi:hypothetical protein
VNTLSWPGPIGIVDQTFSILNVFQMMRVLLLMYAVVRTSAKLASVHVDDVGDLHIAPTDGKTVYLDGSATASGEFTVGTINVGDALARQEAETNALWASARTFTHTHTPTVTQNRTRVPPPSHLPRTPAPTLPHNAAVTTHAHTHRHKLARACHLHHNHHAPTYPHTATATATATPTARTRTHAHN